jgi:sulfate permease, SulP family
VTPTAPPAPTPAQLGWVWRFVPALESLRGYTAAHARADLFAGLTVAAVAVPQAMAYALVAGLPAERGLYTAIVMTAVGSLFDSSKQLINGPTNAISIAVLSAVTSAGAAPDERARVAVQLAFLVGAIQLGIRLLRFGDLTRYISHSVIVGFTLGAGVLLVLDQLKNLLGLRARGGVDEHFLHRLWLTFREGGPVQPAALAVGLSTVGLVLGLRRMKRWLRWPLLPELLLAVVAAAVATKLFGLERLGVAVVGDVPSELPGFRPPEFSVSELRRLAPGALAIAVLGLLEALSMAKTLAAQTGQRLDENQQCLSEAVANLAGSMFGSFPGSGSLTRSAINQQAGAATQWSGVVSAAAVAAITVAFGAYARHIPRAALAGILIVSAARMVDWSGLRYHVRATRFDAAIVGTTAVAAFAVSVEFCVLIGVLMSFLLAVPRAGRVLLAEFTIGADGSVHERLPGDAPCARVLIFGLEGEMFFGAAGVLEQHFAAVERRITPETRVVLLRVKRARNPDAVGLALLDSFLRRLEARGVVALLCGVRAEFAAKMRSAGMARRLASRTFLEQPVRQTSTSLAVRHAYGLLGVPCADCPRQGRAPRRLEAYHEA